MAKVKKTHPTNSVEDGDSNNLAMGIGFGMAIGAMVGLVIFDNISIGIALGLCFGVAFGAGITEKQKKVLKSPKRKDTKKK